MESVSEKLILSCVDTQRASIQRSAGRRNEMSILWEEDEGSVEAYYVFEDGFFVGTLELTRKKVREMTAQAKYILKPVKEEASGNV